MIPPWLLAKAGGHLRTAGISLCPHCGTPTLRGLDADRAGIPTRADIGHLNEMDEARALLQGRATYDLVGTTRKKELEYRYEWHIKSPRRYPVVAAHKCGHPLPVIPAQVPDNTPEAKSDDIPF